eukprot:gnl/TRDRNA2_/TRDRNA2_172545_c2_seq2.p1 gnl/TRDRNA2_/TRDRNA2_172545_c2~~gnl/TRDRNA2_/TRDRNA2_172545_c2_seq2.p1  ORF type:complete len:488 (+),score=39.12 gnl/TRDRNA2_/TRDRNA2_172545_c2_seq2:73-1536(+)
MAADDVVGGLQSIGDVIESIGLGQTHIRQGAVGMGGIKFVCGAALMMVSAVSLSIAQDWHLNSLQRGSMVSMIFVGIFLGNLLSGTLGDYSGRRLPALVAYIGIFIFGTACALSQDFITMCTIRVFLGVSFGLGQPALNVLISEITPAKYRLLVNSCCQSIFAFGEIYSACLIYFDDPYMQDLKWRTALILSVMPAAILGILAYLFLYESPSYQVAQGDYQGATKTLMTMRDINGKSDVLVEFQPPPPADDQSALQGYFQQLKIVYGPHMLYSTLVTAYGCFSLNIVFYGTLYAFPQVVTQVDMGMPPATALILGALWELPGFALAALCCTFCRRIPSMVFAYAVMAGALLAFPFGASLQGEHKSAWYLLQSGFIGIKVLANALFVVVYVYASEIFPVRARITGCAICFAGGRLGGVLAPLTFELMTEATGRFHVFFYVLATVSASNCVLDMFLPIEPFGKDLDALHSEELSDEHTTLVPHKKLSSV